VAKLEDWQRRAIEACSSYAECIDQWRMLANESDDDDLRRNARRALGIAFGVEEDIKE